MELNYEGLGTNAGYSRKGRLAPEELLGNYMAFTKRNRSASSLSAAVIVLVVLVILFNVASRTYACGELGTLYAALKPLLG